MAAISWGEKAKESIESNHQYDEKGTVRKSGTDQGDVKQV